MCLYHLFLYKGKVHDNPVFTPFIKAFHECEWQQKPQEPSVIDTAVTAKLQVSEFGQHYKFSWF